MFWKLRMLRATLNILKSLIALKPEMAPFWEN